MRALGLRGGRWALWLLGVLVAGAGIGGCRAKPALGKVPTQLHRRMSETGVAVRVTYGAQALPIAWDPGSSRVVVGVWPSPPPQGAYLQDAEPGRMVIIDAETARQTAEAPCPLKGGVWPPYYI